MEEVVSVVRAFSADHAVRLTGLSMRQLRYWDDTGFFRPRYAYEDRRSPYSRVYSFRDIVGLRTLSVLRRHHNVPLQHLRKVAEDLSHLGEDLWSETKLYVLDREVYFREPDTGAVRKARGKQYLIEVLQLNEIMVNVSSEAAKLRERTPEQVGVIERHRYIVHNAPVIAGTRIPVAAVRRYLDAGRSVQEILQEYPLLTEADILAVRASSGRPAPRRKVTKTA
jgi:uncharacterized protein (DUF433 family)